MSNTQEPEHTNSILWFKRDLRLHDNAALVQATQHKTVIPLYIIEPELWAQPDMSYRHYLFLQECLEELDSALQQCGSKLIIRIGDAVEILSALTKTYNATAVYSHQETWNMWTYKRDMRVMSWIKSQNIAWLESRQHGVIRRLKDRNGWASLWYKEMAQPILIPPVRINSPHIISDILPSPTTLGLVDDHCLYRQKGGRTEALALLKSFLYQRGEPYTKAMSSPVTAFNACSRISAHIAFGCISLREIFHASEQRSAELAMMPNQFKGKWPNALRSFSGRLRWHCHFIQKLEDEPRIEYEHMHSAYDGLRENEFNDTYFIAWKDGNTGYPMVDACMRALQATGWLNFRMRAMVMSFAAYHLWLDWRKPALHLACMFTDYEPGIHYSQIQMQSGTTGINTIRIYNPIKQGQDHDPDGVFIKQWIPELRTIPIQDIHTPWKHRHLMGDYPMPIIDEKAARKSASDRIWGIRKLREHSCEANAIVKQHGSRKSGLPKTMTQARRKKHHNPNQGELPL